jgi:hypothetical protein
VQGRAPLTHHILKKGAEYYIMSLKNIYVIKDFFVSCYEILYRLSNLDKLVGITSAMGHVVAQLVALQARRSWVQFKLVSLEFFIDIILMALGSTLPLTGMSTRNISWGMKAAGA